MDNQTIPQWLTDAMADYKPSPMPKFVDNPPMPNVGDIVAVRSHNAYGEIVVTETNLELDLVIGMLCTNRIEERTDADILVYREESNLPYTVAVQCDIIGAFSRSTISLLWGKVPNWVIESAAKVQRGDDIGEWAGRLGLPIRSRLNPRWKWKEDEIRHLHRLIAPIW